MRESTTGRARARTARGPWPLWPTPADRCPSTRAVRGGAATEAELAKVDLDGGESP